MSAYVGNLKKSIVDFSDEELQQEIIRRKTKDANLDALKKIKEWSEDAIGYWKVSTEGDVEGRSITDLGIYYGHIADIAYMLSDKVYYKLYFTKASNPHIEIKKKEELNDVVIAIDINSGTWQLPSDQRAFVIAKWLNSTPSSIYGNVEIIADSTYASVKLKGKT